jgi:hypothetical protein
LLRDVISFVWSLASLRYGEFKMRDFLNKIKDVVLIVSAIIGLLFPIGGVIYYALSLEGRVSILENQVRLLNTGQIVTGDTSTESKHDSSATVQPALNPLVATCIDLTKRAADARTASPTGMSLAAITIEQYMSEYGCADALKAAGKR